MSRWRHASKSDFVGLTDTVSPGSDGEQVREFGSGQRAEHGCI